MTEQLDNRAAYIKGLRALADVLEQHEKVPLPASGRPVAINFWSGDPRADMADAARAFPVKWRKHTWEASSSGTAFFELHGDLHGLSIELCTYRDNVCERVVTGTEDREVDEVVTPEVTRKVVKPVEIVEWRCHPLLAPAGETETLVTA